MYMYSPIYICSSADEKERGEKGVCECVGALHGEGM